MQRACCPPLRFPRFLVHLLGQRGLARVGLLALVCLWAEPLISRQATSGVKQSLFVHGLDLPLAVRGIGPCQCKPPRMRGPSSAPQGSAPCREGLLGPASEVLSTAHSPCPPHARPCPRPRPAFPTASWVGTETPTSVSMIKLKGESGEKGVWEPGEQACGRAPVRVPC